MTLSQAACSAESGDQRGLGILTLEADRLLFDGAFRLSVPLIDIQLLRVHRGVLQVIWHGGEAAFELGPRRAQEWADLLREPRSLLDTLGVKPQARVLIVGVSDLGFHRRIKERATVITDRAAAARQPVDMAFLEVSNATELAALRGLEPLLARNGSLWVVYPKDEARVRRADVVAAGRGAGLTDIKQAPFSLTHRAQKFAVPLARR